MKKAVLLLVIVIALGGILSAQEAHKNAFYGGSCGIFGLALCYERVLSPNFSLLIDTGIPLLPNPAIYASAHLRWFPFSSNENVGFFLDAGVGFGNFWQIFDWLILLKDQREEFLITGLILSPGIGLKFGTGKRRGFVFSPSLNFDIYLGGRENYLGEPGSSESHKEDDYLWDKPKFGVGVNPNLKLLFGFAF